MSEDNHFWVRDVINRLPVELLPRLPTWSNLLSAITQLKTERNNALTELDQEKRRLDWLADKDNLIGNVQLPTECVEQNVDSLRGAIDAAMKLDISGDE